MKKLLITAWALALCGLAQAVPPKDHALIHDMVSQLEHFHEAGLALHKQYDYTKADQVTQCKADDSGLVAQATALRDKAAKLPVLAYRVNLTLAASSAVSCLTCSEDGSECNAIPPALQRVHHQLTAPINKTMQ